MGTTVSEYKLAAVALAGGKAVRMEGLDKGLQQYKGRSLVCWTLDCLQSLTQDIVLSCNRNKEVYANLGYPTCADLHASERGPLAGIESAMHYFGARCTHLLVLPCDTPDISDEHLKLMLNASRTEPQSVVVLKSPEGTQYLHAIIPVEYYSKLELFLAQGKRAVRHWYQTLPVLEVKTTQSLPNLNYQHQLTDSAA